MAKQYGSYLGGFSGRLGPAIGYLWNGRWCLRSRPAYVHNPRSEAQVAHRTLFKAEVQLAARLRWALTTALTAQARAMGMTAYNLFVSMNQPCFALAGGEFCVDWEHLQLSQGPVAPVALGTPAVDADNVLTVSFERNAGMRRSKARDLVHLYVYCPEAGRGVLAAPVYRRDQRIRLLLPEAFRGRTLAIYGFAQDEQGEFSPTDYAGCTAAAPQADGVENLSVTENQMDGDLPCAARHRQAAATASTPLAPDTASMPVGGGGVTVGLAEHDQGH